MLARRILAIVLVLVACGGCCRKIMVGGNSQSEVLKQVIMNAPEGTAFAVPAMEEPGLFLLSSPYHLTEEWLVNHTDLTAFQRRQLVDANNAVENVLLAFISGKCVRSTAWLTDAYVLETGVLVVSDGDEIVVRNIDRIARPLEISYAGRQ